MPSLLDCLSDCQPKVRSDLMSFLNITSNELAQEMTLLREAGLNIQEENEVYLLVPEMPLLNPRTILDALFPYSVHYHRTISSTNEFITNHINQLKKGDLCLAEYQTAGRGRRGRKWLTPYAGQLIYSFYCTIDPKKALDGLSIVIGVANADREKILIKVNQRIYSRLAQFEEKGIDEEFMQQWINHNEFFGDEVNVFTEQDAISGIEQGIDKHGYLKVITDEGERYFNAGEVSLRRK